MHFNTCAALTMVIVATTAGEAQTPAATRPTIAWQNGPVLQLPRDHHATFVVRAAGGDFLYIAGGTNYKDMYDDIVRARIGATGGLGAFESAGTYPAKLAGTSVAVAGNYAVLTGGQIATAGPPRALKRVADSYVAPIDAQGRLGAWKAAPALPAPRFHHPSLFHNGWVYVVGGQGEKEAEAGIFAAQVGADGSIAQWQQLRPLPRPRSHHAVFVADSFMYVIGGLDGAVNGHGAHFTDVIRAPVQADGSLGEWRIVSRAPHAYATHAAFAHDGYLWILGGVEDGNRFVDSVWRAQVAADGRVCDWQEVKPGLPIARGHVHNTPVLNGHLYSAGGRITPTAGEMNVVTGASHIGTFGK
jgi:hypothetical protein